MAAESNLEGERQRIVRIGNQKVVRAWQDAAIERAMSAPIIL